jgi:hypothetical protein
MWAQLSASRRLLWLHAACLEGDNCCCPWVVLSLDERTALMITLGDIVEFFQTLEELS